MSKVNKYKIVFTGDQYVGKTSIISRFILDQYDDNHNVSFYNLYSAYGWYWFLN